MIVKEIIAKSIISKSNLPDADYVINPYSGCSHRCIYCYARFMKRFTNHQEPWGSYIDVKRNGADCIPEKSTKYQGKSIFLSSVTDPYVPQEKQYKLTRHILSKLISLKPRLGLLTKSGLISRDIDILTQFEDVEAGCTITTIDETLRREIEPGASPIQDRIEALRILFRAGITTCVFIGPIFPFLTDIKAIIEATRQFTSFYMFENLNLKGIQNSIDNWYKQFHPECAAKYSDFLNAPKNFWNQMEETILEYAKKEGLDCRIYFHHQRSS